MRRFCAGSLLISMALLLACTNNDFPGGSEDTGTSAADETGEPEPPSLRMFVSSEIYAGNLGGVAGADLKCQDLADAAGLDGDFTAWVSADGFGVALRLDHTGERYVLINGSVVAQNWDDLVDGEINVPISIDENGELVDIEEQSAVWTGTDKSGAFFGPDCNGWTTTDPETFGLVGDVEITNAGWSSIGSVSCGSLRRLFCVEGP